LPRKLSIESYVRIVRDKSLMRQLMTVCDMGMVDAADQSQEAVDVLNSVSNAPDGDLRPRHHRRLLRHRRHR
jgi:replicative DNA helicase